MATWTMTTYGIPSEHARQGGVCPMTLEVSQEDIGELHRMSEVPFEVIDDGAAVICEGKVFVHSDVLTRVEGGGGEVFIRDRSREA